MRGETNVTLQTHQILRLPRKMTIQHLAEICEKQLKRHFQCAADPRPFREWSEHDPIRFRQSATRHATEVTFRAPEERFVLKNTTFRAPAIFPNLTKYCACHEKWHLNFTKYCAYHEKWHLNFTKYCAYHAKWHLNFTKYCAYHAKWHLNFTKYCAYHAKWHLTFTKYCACHTEWLAGLILVTYETSFPSGRNLRKTAETSFPMRGRSEHDPNTIRSRSETVPRPFPSVRNPPRNRGYFSRSGRTVCIEKYNISRSGYLSKSHQVLGLPRKVTLELHQVLRLPRKVTLELHQVLRLPRKVTLELHQVLRPPRKVTLELHQVLRPPRKVTLELHQVLRLPRKLPLDLHQLLRLLPTQRLIDSTTTQRF